MNKDYDLIVIGTGAGGGTLVHSLAESGKKILILERGDFLPREKENWDTVSVFQHDRYHTSEVWKDKQGHDIHPGTGYWVGGNTKVYGAALFRLREKDFGQINHKGGISPAWPLTYADFEPWYQAAENLYSVHGKKGLDPTEPFMSGDYPYQEVSHEPRIQQLHDSLRQKGLNPFYIPLGIKLNEKNRLESLCIRCNTCDGFPCLVDAKADSDINAVRPALPKPNITLVTKARVNKLLTSPTGREITGVETTIDGETHIFTAGIVVVSCGAINSAALLLQSANDQHSHGLANSSGMVGRNLMKHQNGAMLAISSRLNPTVFQKTLAINDFYWGEDDFPYPMGHIQLLGKANKDMLVADAPIFTPGLALDQMASHSIDWWMTAEDLPDPENRVWVEDGGIRLNYTDNNTEAYTRLVDRWTAVLQSVDEGIKLIPHTLYLRKKIPIQGVAHQCGTTRFGEDPSSSVLDINCKAHDLDNLYVVDGGFFPSSGALNPSLTIMANALRVGEHLKERLGAG